MDLAITPVHAHDAIVVHLAGKIDAGTASRLRQHFLHLFAAGHFRLVADLQHVTFLDAAGIDVLLVTHAHARSRRGFLRLACAPAVLKIFHLDGLPSDFRVYDNLEAAVTDPSPPGPEDPWGEGNPPWWPPAAPAIASGDLERAMSDEVIRRADRFGPAELAGQGADAIAALVWATLPMADGLEHAGDVSDVLLELASLAELLPQISQQICGFLRTYVAQAGVRAVPGFPYAGDPEAALTEAARHLAQVDDLAAQLRHVWRSAQQAITGLVIDPPPNR